MVTLLTPTMPTYPSDLTKVEWSLLAQLLSSAQSGGHPGSVDLRRILDGLWHLVRHGCACRALPHDTGPWSIVYMD